MPEEYTKLVTALKSLEQAEDEKATPPVMVNLPMAEGNWDVRPNCVSYGMVNLDFETPSLDADNVKQDRAYEGSVDLFSLERSGAGWVKLITDTLSSYCGACWSLNSHTYETETSLFHWEWTFQVVG